MMGKTATTLRELGQIINVEHDKRMFAVKEIAAKAPKTLVFTDARNGSFFESNPQAIGKNVYVRLGLHGVDATEEILEEFDRAMDGVLVAPYAFNTGWRVRGVTSIVFLDLSLNRTSAQFIQAIARVWPEGPNPLLCYPFLHFVNCDLDSIEM
jgi:hypothetical protein